ncbi:FAD-dependent oxidoreductase [Mycolicibacterium frederiksbergense]|uniref:FAD-dependent oxidoreductase n=1 Tax=Mycolicibacterium frederiksbergense TaxID=117567 RepID=UPI00265C8147|nr:2-polyprenyl-6-methoxyphenol hydroxylase-like oxidoreductase [Mycolicibacterium frederiksbergense]MDO0976614.1 2-polyprenyl-6-methoxyphenol hydroxylase-like oxidoreductase [Mycolicibacterium frederiksbergense]
MSGLLAARVLAEACDTVTVIERDVLPDRVSQRPGVQQGLHLHMLLSSGLGALEDLLPGIGAELRAQGAPVLDTRDLSQAYLEINGHVLCRDGTVADPEAIQVVLASRPLLESVVRERIRALSNVTFLDGHDVIEPTLSGRTVTGVKVGSRRAARTFEVPADVVVDSSGRSARTPAFLEAHGFGRPVEQTYRVQLSYASQLFRVPGGLLHEKAAVISPNLQRPTGAGMLANENGTVIFTLIGIGGQRLPADLPSVLEGAARLLPRHISSALEAAEPLGELHHRRYPVSVWRRYDKLTSFPVGLLVMGDAVCSFNPVYGQGMTSAAQQARALRKAIADHGFTDLSRAYFRTAARRIAPVWHANRLNDFAVTPETGWAMWPQRAFNTYTTAYMAAASDDAGLTEAFLRVLQGRESGFTLASPVRAARVVAHSVRRR